MDLAQILTEEVWQMELVNNNNRLLLVATSHRNITSISNTLVHFHGNRFNFHDFDLSYCVRHFEICKLHNSDFIFAISGFGNPPKQIWKYIFEAKFLLIIYFMQFKFFENENRRIDGSFKNHEQQESRHIFSLNLTECGLYSTPCFKGLFDRFLQLIFI